MRLYVAFIVVLCGCLAEKEVPEEYASVLTDRLIQEIQKRWSLYPDDDDDAGDGTDNKPHQQTKGSVNGAKPTCDFSIVVGQIIKTHDSLNSGAVYIDAPASKTRDACGAECCSSKTCDLAVFKDKGDEHACYLFKCNGVCLFTNHTGFSTMARHRMPQQHEADLAGLATSPPATTTGSTTTTIVATTTTTSTEATTTRKPLPVNKEPAALFGVCQKDTDCAGSGTECLAGYCVCKEGYHAQEGICNFVEALDSTVDQLLMEVLNHLSKEVDKEGPKGRPKPPQPEHSVPHYQQEKGHTDGTDATRAETSGVHGPIQTQGTASNGQRWNKNEGGPQKGTHPAGSAGVDSPNRGHPVQRPSQNVTPEGGTGDEHKVPTSAKAPQKPVETPIQISAVMDKITPSRNDALPSTAQPSVKTKAPETPKPPAKVEKKHKPLDTDKKNVALKPLTGGSRMSGQTSPAVSIEELNEAETEKKSPLKTNKTAVVVLALGLAVTAVLLMFVGCRLRMVKRRLRRGRPLNSNEADYLINGMYL